MMKFDLMLDLSDKNFANDLMEALGVKEGDTVEIITPQFARTDARAITYYPRTLEEFSALHTFSKETLQKIGLGIWDGDSDKTHWLYPGEWFNYIPDGMLVTDINGVELNFMKAICDDDTRYGMLAYGFIQTNTES